MFLDLFNYYNYHLLSVFSGTLYVTDYSGEWFNDATCILCCFYWLIKYLTSILGLLLYGCYFGFHVFAPGWFGWRSCALKINFFRKNLMLGRLLHEKRLQGNSYSSLSFSVLVDSFSEKLLGEACLLTSSNLQLESVVMLF